MALNKDEPHIVALTKTNRLNLELFIDENIYENDNKEISATDVAEMMKALVRSGSNLLDDNLDLRGYASHKFALADCTLLSGVYTYTLAHSAVNPDDDSEFTWEGIVCDYGTEYEIAGTALTFKIDSSVTVTSDLEFAIKYRYFI